MSNVEPSRWRRARSLGAKVSRRVAVATFLGALTTCQSGSRISAHSKEVLLLMTRAHALAVEKLSARGLKAELARLWTEPVDPGARPTVPSNFGFGVTLEQVSIGAYTNGCSVDVEAHLDAVISVEISCAGDAADGVALAAAARDLPFEVTARSEGLYAKLVHADAAKQATDARAAKLGPLRPVVAPEELREAYETLDRGGLTVGRYCNRTGTGPDGVKELRLLVEAGSVDLLRNLLRSKGPEARVMAAQALRELGAVDALDQAAITAIEGEDTEIQICGGCIYTVKTARAILEQPVRRLP